MHLALRMCKKTRQTAVQKNTHTRSRPAQDGRIWGHPDCLARRELLAHPFLGIRNLHRQWDLVLRPGVANHPSPLAQLACRVVEVVLVVAVAAAGRGGRPRWICPSLWTWYGGCRAVGCAQVVLEAGEAHLLLRKRLVRAWGAQDSGRLGACCRRRAVAAAGALDARAWIG